MQEIIDCSPIIVTVQILRAFPVLFFGKVNTSIKIETTSAIILFLPPGIIIGVVLLEYMNIFSPVKI